MEKLKLINSLYLQSESMRVQGTNDALKPFKGTGFYQVSNNNGNHLMNKPAQVLACFQVDGVDTAPFEMEIKEDLLLFYGKTKIRETLLERFKKEVGDGTIEVYLDNSQLVIKNKE